MPEIRRPPADKTDKTFPGAACVGFVSAIAKRFPSFACQGRPPRRGRETLQGNDGAGALVLGTLGVREPVAVRASAIGRVGTSRAS